MIAFKNIAVATANVALVSQIAEQEQATALRMNGGDVYVRLTKDILYIQKNLVYVLPKNTFCKYLRKKGIVPAMRFARHANRKEHGFDTKDKAIPLKQLPVGWKYDAKINYGCHCFEMQKKEIDALKKKHSNSAYISCYKVYLKQELQSLKTNERISKDVRETLKSGDLEKICEAVWKIGGDADMIPMRKKDEDENWFCAWQMLRPIRFALATEKKDEFAKLKQILNNAAIEMARRANEIVRNAVCGQCRGAVEAKRYEKENLEQEKKELLRCVKEKTKTDYNYEDVVSKWKLEIQDKEEKLKEKEMELQEAIWWN